MDGIEVDAVAEYTLTDPVLIEGLPGVGHVGKLAAEHLLEEFPSTRLFEVVSEEFPPQVTVDDEGVARLVHASFHAVDTGDRDLLVLTGDHQAQTNRGHYTLASQFLDIAESVGVTAVYALGGVPTGELVDDPGVLAAVTEDGLREPLETVGVQFREGEPAGGIVGVSGLLLGLAARRGVPATCLMGETSGYLVDPQSARAILEVLAAQLGFTVEYGSLEERAAEMAEVVEKIEQMQMQQTAPAEDDLRYIG
jgi:uncharacterized protein (TIGR00162 family)